MRIGPSLVTLACADDDAQGQERLIGAIRDSSLNLLGLIDNILDLTKLESGTAVIEVEPMSVEPILEEVRALEANLAAAGVRIYSPEDGRKLGLPLVTKLNGTLFGIRDATQIHMFDRGRRTRFDHGKTRFALSGKHAQARCDSCHRFGQHLWVHGLRELGIGGLGDCARHPAQGAAVGPTGAPGLRPLRM